MKIAIFGNAYQHKSLPYVNNLLQELLKQGVEVMIERSFHDFLCSNSLSPLHAVSIFDSHSVLDADMVFSIGGDGTFLRTAHVAARHDLPIMGFNAGHLGYLATATIEEACGVVNRVLERDYFIENRTMLAWGLESGVEPRHRHALNEIAILRQDTSSMIEVEVNVGNTPLTTYKGDGLLVCTPTGSTAYNLSVGGPVLEPLTQCVVLSPISPHSLTMRPVVIRDSHHLTITTRSRASLYQVSVDGETANLPSGTTLHIGKAPFCAHVVQLNGHDFASTLRSKLMWGKDNR